MVVQVAAVRLGSGAAPGVFLMAERAAVIENARTLYLEAALRRDAGEIFPEPEAAMAKRYGIRLAVGVARRADQACGGLGFPRELSADDTPGPVEAIYHDSRIGENPRGNQGDPEVDHCPEHRLGKEITG
ncbi:acyl-CoA dehydrogenase family protein [Streptomyces sp. NPDC051956]|uniref:acyl-CoA dehydrogenase family protein n=1 Tax=Streptomyces sp. NPDC051956 TaxID=3365677 RepID=UPI0037D021D1